MVVGLIVSFIVLAVLAVVAAAGYVIDGSVPDDGSEVPVAGPEYGDAVAHARARSRLPQ